MPKLTNLLTCANVMARTTVAALIVALVLAVLAGTLLTSIPIEAQQPSTYLFKNTGQPINSLIPSQLDTEYQTLGQAFTTGSDATEYRLDSIGIRFGTIHADASPATELTVTLNHVKGRGLSPDPSHEVICTLTNPATFTSNAVNTFDAPTSGDLCPFLKANTRYAVAVARANANTHEISNP